MKVGLLLAPLLPAILYSIWAWQKSPHFDTLAIVFGMVYLAGYATEMLLAIPIYKKTNKKINYNIFTFTLLVLLSAVFMALIIEILTPSRVPWYTGFLNLSKFSILGGLIMGVTLWLIGIQKQMP
jgi:hypothetical protein